MKKIVLITGLLTGCIAPGISQNYISGVVSLYGNNTASGTTTVAPGAAFYFHNNTFYEQAAFINQGDSVAISANNGRLALNGSAAQMVSGRFTIGALQLLNAAGASINTNVFPTMVTILDSVGFGNISNTTLNAADSLLTLRSTGLKTARIADLTHKDVYSGNKITGKVVAERFLQNKRAWRLLCPPTTADSTGSQTIKEAWQEGATAPSGQIVNPNPGYGTVITRPGSNPATATGYDDGVPYATGYSLRTYTSNGLLTQPANTDLTHFSPHAAYLVQVRGDRSVPPEVQTATYQTPPTATNLRSKGALHNGTVKDTITNGAGAFAGVGNPYASTIDFSKLTLNGIANGFYAWDPNIGTLGAWLYVDGDDFFNATPLVPPGIGSYTNAATNPLIQSGQAILVKPTGSTGYITFTESSKDLTSRVSVFRVMPLPSVNISLYADDDSLGYVFTDGTAAVFDDAFSKAALLEEDIYKPGNITENLSFYTKGSFLMKEKWPLPVIADTLPLQLWKTSAKNYRFIAEATHMEAQPQAYLVDKYLQTSAALSPATPLTYDFQINSDAASKATDRFLIVFGAGTVLSVTFTQIKAYLQNDNIMVQWDVQNERGIVRYEVEKSADARTFAKIGTVAAKGENATVAAYSLLDAQPFSGDNYYRVKGIGLNGEVTYTSIVKVMVAIEPMIVTVYPNPVKHGKIQLLFKNAPAGKYLLTLFGSDGKKIFVRSVVHAGGTATYTLPPVALAQGIYHLQVAGDTGNTEKRDLPVMISE